jgi:Flp pilus assembly protein TadG
MMFRKPIRLQRFAAADKGAAMVEFALVAPFLAALIVGVAQYGGMLIAYQKMHNGVESGAVYVMRGGSGVSTIHDVALNAWTTAPADATISVNQACSCSSVVSACTSLCADGSYPQAYTTIGGSATYAGPFSNQAMSTSQTVRTQ